jgi:predicted dehydrogenase
MRRPNIGIVGLGKMGSLEARKCGYLHQLNVMNFSAISDIDVSKRNTAESEYGRPFYTDAEEMYRRENLDGVIIATQVDSHKENAMAAIDAGIKDIFLEKPGVATTHLDDGFELQRYAERAGTKIMVGYIVCYEQVIDKYMQIKGSLGTILRMKVDREGPRPFRFKKLDAFSDLGVYALVVPNYTLGWQEVSLGRSSFASFFDSENVDECLFTANSESGVEFIGHAEWFVDQLNKRPKIRRTYVLGDRGYMVINHEAELLFIADNKSFEQMTSADVSQRMAIDESGMSGKEIHVDPYDKETDDTMCRELKHFVSVITDDIEPRTPLNAELKTLKGAKGIFGTT